ncbi:SDR family NAD(P)-dependent oxidoreductase [Pleomorphovibrio marinus]|uniref:SDR family NAD(P)-dependent oxidoreductase n=1 Tax=Pleomorphovibrio marinus TaxID=2164132 RepID=UPI000E0CA7D4|nr:SDR family NAD(P)-dependent oxidoreductase [Pleomorphovibrio marinus]
MKNQTHSLFIITGASKGLGRAMVQHLTKNPKHEVVGVSRSPIPSTTNYKHVAIDLADLSKLRNALPEIFPKGDYDKVILVNNAGWIGEIAPLGKLDPEGINAIHQINIVAPAVLMNAFISNYKALKAQKTVVNISSGAAGKAVDGWSGYCASKAALNQMTLVADAESKLNHYGIRYYALSPGIIDTPMQENIRSAGKENFSQIEKFKNFKSQNELSSPEDTAKKVMYLIENRDEFTEVLQDVREF